MELPEDSPKRRGAPMRIVDPGTAREICRLYTEEGLSCIQLRRMFGLGEIVMRRVLLQGGATLRDASERRRKHQVDHNFFNVIDTEAKAYWLGFLAADGNVSSSNNLITLTLQHTDRPHILKFKEALRATHTVRYIESSDASTFAVSSPDMKRDLIIAGITPKKSKTLQWPTCVPNDLIHHFMRGVFDGDGSIFQYGSLPSQTCFDITGSYPLVREYQKVLASAASLNLTKIYRKAGCCYIRYTGVHQLRRIFSFLYKDATIFLERKASKVMQLDLHSRSGGSTIV